MQSSQLLAILRRLNKYPTAEFYTKYQLSQNVELAHIWDDKDHYKPNTYFLIKENDVYIGIVLDMGIDLHWVIQPGHRKKGHLINALQKAILPYFFNVEIKEKVKITIDADILKIGDYNASVSVAKKAGFKKVGGKHFVINAEDYDYKLSELNIIYSGLEIDEVAKVKKQFTMLAKKLSYLNSKIEMSFGIETANYMTLSLFEISSKINNYKYGLDDMVSDYYTSTET